MQALSRTAHGAALRARAASQQRATAIWHRSAPPKHAARLTPIRRFADDKQQGSLTQQADGSPAVQLEQLASRLEAVERECASLRSQLHDEDGSAKPPRPSSSSSGSSGSGSSGSSGSGSSSDKGSHPRGSKEHEDTHGTDAASSGHAKEENKPKIAADEQTPEAETENRLRSIHPKVGSCSCLHSLHLMQR